MRRTDFGEADRLLLLVTPAGKQRVVAKGVRKTNSRLAGHIELFVQCQLMLAVGRNLDIVTQSQLVQSFPVMHADLGRLSCAYYVAELYDRLTQEEEAHAGLFRLLTQVFAAIDQTANLDLVVRACELQLLHIAGYRPHFHRCPVCQDLLTEQANRFSPTLGGVVCQRDSVADRQALPMSLNTFKLLRFLQTQPLAAIEQLALSQSVRDEAAALLRAYVRPLLERELKSVAFLDEMMRNP